MKVCENVYEVPKCFSGLKSSPGDGILHLLHAEHTEHNKTAETGRWHSARIIIYIFFCGCKQKLSVNILNKKGVPTENLPEHLLSRIYIYI